MNQKFIPCTPQIVSQVPMPYSLFNHSPAEGLLSCFSFIDINIMKEATISIHAQSILL